MDRAIAALEAHGASVLEAQGWARPDGIGEITLGLPGGVAVDLHADLVHRADVRRDLRLPAEPLLARATTVAVLDRPLPVLDPEDNLIHVALHAMLSGGDRLVWLADLHALVGRGDIQWPVLVDRAVGARVALIVGVTLERASMVLATPVPADVRQALRRRGRLWAALLAGWERRRPTACSYGRVGRGQVLMRATRDTSARSLATQARLVWSDVIVFEVTDPGHPWRRRLRHRLGRRSRS